MKKIIILLALLAAIIIGAVVSGKKKNNRLGASVQMREKLLPGLADTATLNSIKKIHVKEGDKEVTFALTGDKWSVAERDGYPGAYEKIRTLLLDLSEQKIASQGRVGKGAWGDVKLLAPGQGDATKTGLMVELMDDKGKVVKSFVLGDTVTKSVVGKQENMFGGGGNERYARVPEDGDTTVWLISNAPSELKAAPEDWVSKEFIDVQKVKIVDVTAASAGDSWKVSRDEESKAEFSFADAKSGEEFDNAKASLGSLLGGATFNDVVNKAKATADFMKGAIVAKLTTFDGFTYTVNVLKKGTGAEEKGYLTITVAADFPKARPAVKDEKEEDKKKKDEEFTKKIADLNEKLAKEKKYEGWTFEVSSYAIDALLKKRSEVIKDKPAPEAPKPTNVSGSPVGLPSPVTTPDGATKIPMPFNTTPGQPAPTLPPTGERPKPSAPITVTTPPVSVPAQPTEKPKVEAPKVEAPKVEVPKVEAPKADATPAPAAEPKKP